MKKTIILLYVFLGLISCEQNLKCEDFKNGTFLIPGDSIYPISFNFKRSDGKQVEWKKGGDSTFAEIKYIDDCNYILTYNSELNKMDKMKHLINNSGGVKVNVLKIKGDTMFYNGVLKNDTLNFEQPGMIIKLK